MTFIDNFLQRMLTVLSASGRKPAFKLKLDVETIVFISPYMVSTASLNSWCCLGLDFVSY